MFLPAFAGVLEKVSARKSALCKKISLSEPHCGEFEIFLHVFSNYSQFFDSFHAMFYNLLYYYLK